MNIVVTYLLLTISLIFGVSTNSLKNNAPAVPAIGVTTNTADKQVETACNDNFYSLSESHCASAFNGVATTYTLNEGNNTVGHSVWISRKTKRAKAKYFAHRQDGHDVHDRYTTWRVADKKNVILKSSGTYATGWNNSDLPVGITVDNGAVVNKDYHNTMDGLVIIYATGGIAVSNIEDGDLYLESLNREVNVTDYFDRYSFLNWAKKEKATVFQTHLLAYKNKNEVGRSNSSNNVARRKLLALAKSSSGELFHIIFYFKNKAYTIYESTELVLNYLSHTKSMDVIAMINLDTGGYDILNMGGDAKDCNDALVWGTTSNYEDMTNLLAYHFE